MYDPMDEYYLEEDKLWVNRVLNILTDAMPPNFGGRCVSYTPGRRGQKISETAILPNTQYRGVLKIVTF